MDLLSLLTQVAYLAGQILAGQISLTQAFNVLASDVAITAKEHTPYQVETNTTNTQLAVQNPTYGLAALDAKLTTINTNVLAIQHTDGANQVVNLPSTAPAGYGGLDATATGNAVWDYVSSDEATTAHVILAALSTFLRFVRDSGAYPIRIGDHFYANFSPFDMIDNPNLSFPSHSAQEILSTDADLGAFLQRIEGPGPWNQLGDGTFWKALGGSFGNASMYCSLTPAEFEWFRLNNAGLVQATQGAPVWPGLANVTLGAPVAFAGSSITVPGPMDGVLIDITTPPQPAQSYDFDGSLSWRYLGGIAFEDDNGHLETAQLLGFELGNYSPKEMVQAANCKIRYKSGTVGTATPWTKT